ncbi:MAG: molybdate ABC transporter substrate-binding protein [Pseudomonadota bacterium]
MAAVILVLFAAITANADDKPIYVYAAASTKQVIDDLSLQFNRDTGYKIQPVYAGTSVLARQISQGAPADIFVSANLAWMDYLSDAKLINDQKRFNLANNRLVLVQKTTSQPPSELTPDQLSKFLARRSLTSALVDAVPAGMYAKAALQHLNAWEQAKTRLVQTDNVRAALQLVVLGEVELGLVYASDLYDADPARVRLLMTLPSDSHPRIVYPVTSISRSTHPGTSKFLAYLRSDDANATLAKYLFLPVES